jgi:hypothetical protein
MDLQSFFLVFLNLINNALIPLVVALAVLAFLWGIVVYVLADSDSAKEKGRNFMIWGIVGIFVMVSVWGLVAVLTGSFGLTSTPPTLPIVR